MSLKLKAPEGAENLRGLTVEIKDGFIEIDESEAAAYYQLGFHQVDVDASPAKTTRQKTE